MNEDTTQQPIQYQTWIISDSTNDEEFTQRRSLWMRDHALHKVDRAIQVKDRLLLVLSEYSMNSEWVRREIKRARATEGALGAGLATPPLGATAGLPESLETCGRQSAGLLVTKSANRLRHAD